jgi:hypothetical protein
MNNKITIAQLLRWRLDQAETDAPPPPRAARLIELARPWWETWPEQFQAAVERLGKIRIAYGHAMAKPGQSHSGHPVPALILHEAEKLETSARVLYLSIRDGRLRLRFQLDMAAPQDWQIFEVTFIARQSHPVLSASAVLAVDNQYRIDTELPEHLVPAWEHLGVTDEMPFQFILRPGKNSSGAQPAID